MSSYNAEIEASKARSPERNTLSAYVDGAILKYAHLVVAPVWDNVEDWKNATPITVNFLLLDLLCTTPLIRSCVQYRQAYEAHEQWNEMIQRLDALKVKDEASSQS